MAKTKTKTKAKRAARKSPKKKSARAKSPKRKAAKQIKELVQATERICNLVPSTGIETDWQFGDALAAGALAAPPTLPSSVDLRASWWNIGDQEDTGSCVGWATGDGVVRYHLVQAGKIQPSDFISPRYIWMASKETDEFVARPESFIEKAGTSLKAAINICAKYGVVTTSLLPFYISNKMFTGDDNQFYAAAAQLRITSYFNLFKNTNEWKSWLASKGPILAGFNVDQTWRNCGPDGKLDTFQPGTVKGGHAVAIVGYTSSNYFIIRNSWGKTWGRQGLRLREPGVHRRCVLQ